MTTIAKVAAVLGVIAGFGAASIPISTFAATEDVPVSITINSTLGTDDATCDTASTSGEDELLNGTAYLECWQKP